jgi:hypothetical protein
MPTPINNRSAYRPSYPSPAAQATRPRRKARSNPVSAAPSVQPSRPVVPRLSSGPRVGLVRGPGHILSKIAGYAAPVLLLAGIVAFCVGCMPAGGALVAVAFIVAIVRYQIRWPKSLEAMHEKEPGYYYHR